MAGVAGIPLINRRVLLRFSTLMVQPVHIKRRLREWQRMDLMLTDMLYLLTAVILTLNAALGVAVVIHIVRSIGAKRSEPSDCDL